MNIHPGVPRVAQRPAQRQLSKGYNEHVNRMRKARGLTAIPAVASPVLVQARATQVPVQAARPAVAQPLVKPQVASRPVLKLEPGQVTAPGVKVVSRKPLVNPQVASRPVLKLGPDQVTAPVVRVVAPSQASPIVLSNPSKPVPSFEQLQLRDAIARVLKGNNLPEEEMKNLEAFLLKHLPQNTTVPGCVKLHHGDLFRGMPVEAATQRSLFVVLDPGRTIQEVYVAMSGKRKLEDGGGYLGRGAFKKVTWLKAMKAGQADQVLIKARREGNDECFQESKQSIVEEERFFARLTDQEIPHCASAAPTRFLTWTSKKRGFSSQFAYITGRYAGDMDKEQARFQGQEQKVGKQLLEFAVKMQKSGLSHGDLKEANILVDESGNVAVSDFGTGKEPNAPLPSRYEGTPLYLAPEFLAIDRNRDKFWGDAYAIGCILHRLFTGEPEHKGQQKLKTWHRNTRGIVPLKEAAEPVKKALKHFCDNTQHLKFKQDLEGSLNTEQKAGLSQLIRGLLQPEPPKRWTAEKALKQLQAIFLDSQSVAA